MPGISTNWTRPLSAFISTRTVSSARTRPLFAQEPLVVDRVLADAPFLVGRRDAEDVGPLGPGVGGCPAVGRPGHDLELMDALAALAVDGAQAVGAGVAAADDDDVLVAGRDEFRVVDRVAGDPPVLAGQELHREVDALELAPFDRQVARLGRAAAEADRVELGRAARRAVTSTPTLVAWPEDDALGLHLLEPAVEEPLFHLEVGDAVAEQAADAVGALEDGDRVAGAGKLLGAGQARRAGADDRHRLAGLDLGRLRDDPAFVPGPVDDAGLDLLDRRPGRC